MRRSYIIALMLMLTSTMMASIHTYVDKSVLKDGRFVKISVKESGIHSISYDALKEWGIEPTNVAILGYGGAMMSENFMLTRWDDLPSVAFYMHKGADGIFNKGDYILFYAQGPTKWSANNRTWYHTQNPYSMLGYYFVTDKQDLQRIIEPSSEQQNNTTSIIDVDWYTSLHVYERDSFNLIDLKGQSGGGREFYGEFFNEQAPNRTFWFELSDVRTDLTAQCVVDLAAVSGNVTPLQIGYANESKSLRVAAISQTDFHTKAITAKTTITAKPSSAEKQAVEIQFKGSKGAIAYLNSIELHVPCSLKMRGNELNIVNIDRLGDSKLIRFNMACDKENVQIWRVTDGVNIEQVPVEYDGETLKWVTSNETAERYIAVDVNAKDWKTPTKVGIIANQNLHALQNVDYVIICPEALPNM